LRSNFWQRSSAKQHHSEKAGVSRFDALVLLRKLALPGRP
jgi:hypothetical protein